MFLLIFNKKKKNISASSTVLVDDFVAVFVMNIARQFLEYSKGDLGSIMKISSLFRFGLDVILSNLFR